MNYGMMLQGFGRLGKGTLKYKELLFVIIDFVDMYTRIRLDKRASSSRQICR